MKILVCISQVPDTTTKIAFKENNTQFDSTNVQFIINPYDEWYGLVRALEIKEANTGSTVTIINVGKAENEQTIRKALAIGADDAVRIDAEATDAYFVAFQLAEYAKKEKYDLIFLGKETINYNGSVVGGMVAELLGLPYVSIASKMDIQGTAATFEREIEGGKETVTANLPLVVSAQKGMAEQRIPNMRGIMAARTKPLKVEQPVSAEALTTIKSYELPPAKGVCKMIAADNVEELVNLLHNEAKVI